MIGGQTADTFTLRTLAPAPAPDRVVAAAVKARSLRRYGRPAEDLDRELSAALGTATGQDDAPDIDVGRMRPR